jgi:UDP-3-O-[3-hydroxymyristoyl] glucosamine N-acyltransferase
MQPPITIQIIAHLLNGSIEGDASLPIHAPSKIEEGGAGTLTFLANSKYEPHLYTTSASAVLVQRDFAPTKPVKATLIRVENVQVAMASLMQQFDASKKNTIIGISKKTSLHTTARLGTGVNIGAFTVIQENATIGDNTTIFPQVFIGKNVAIGKNTLIYAGAKIYHDCVIGDNVVIHANVVIGSDGFGFAQQNDGTYLKIPQLGNVVIENNVEIGANSTIDRASMGSTLLKEGVKLDNLVQIAHNVTIGKNTVLASQSGVAGSSKVGDNCQIGGQVGIIGHLTVSNRTFIQGQSGVVSNIKEENTKWYGTPAIDYMTYLRGYSQMSKLPDMAKQLRTLQATIAEMQAVLDGLKRDKSDK